MRNKGSGNKVWWYSFFQVKVRDNILKQQGAYFVEYCVQRFVNTEHAASKSIRTVTSNCSSIRIHKIQFFAHTGRFSSVKCRYSEKFVKSLRGNLVDLKECNLGHCLCLAREYKSCSVWLGLRSLVLRSTLQYLSIYKVCSIAANKGLGSNTNT